MKKIIGIDENGFGALSGPLIITGTLIELKKEVWFEDVCDSKKFFSSRNKNSFKKLEEFVIAIYYCINGKFPESPKEIIKQFSSETRCFQEIDLCFLNIPTSFFWADIKNAEKYGKKFQNWAENEGISIKKIKSEIICAKKFNELIKKGNSKFIIDLSSFCKIVKKIKEDDIFIYAGKIGGMKYYHKYLRYFFPEYEIYQKVEKEEKSIYSFEGIDNFIFGFFLNVEDISFPASISSIVGKYIREIIMKSFIKSTGIKEEISGYRDKKTKKQISLLSSFPQQCIIRIK